MLTLIADRSFKAHETTFPMCPVYVGYLGRPRRRMDVFDVGSLMPGTARTADDSGTLISMIRNKRKSNEARTKFIYNYCNTIAAIGYFSQKIIQ